MDLLDILKYIVIPVLLCYIGYNEKDKRDMRLKADGTVPRDQIEKLIDLKMALHQIEIRDIKEDLRRIEGKLDGLITALSHH